MGHALVTHDIADSAALETERAREVARIFGIHGSNTTRRLLENVKVPTTGLTLITGSSGSGKSTLLRRIIEMYPRASTLESSLPSDRAVVDCISGNTADAIHWLGKFGLGEARVLLTRPSVLSEGQRHRLLLARLLWERPPVLLVDEFLSVLDRVTAKAIAHGFQKVCREANLTAYVVSAHDDFVDELRPDSIVRLDLDGTSTTTTCSWPNEPIEETSFGREIDCREGSIADYEALKAFHYRDEEDPEVWADILHEVRVARFRGRVVAVKLFTRPFTRALEHVPLLAELNRRILVQERTVVHPTFRGLALNRLLVPTAPYTAEVLFSQSALGLYFPFNLKAGYVRIDHPAETPHPSQLALKEGVLRLASSPQLNLHSSAQLQRLLASAAADDHETIRALARVAFTVSNLRYVAFLSELVQRSLGQSELSELQFLFEEVYDATADVSGGLAGMVESAMPFPMAGFVLRLAPSAR